MTRRDSVRNKNFKKYPARVPLSYYNGENYQFQYSAKPGKISLRSWLTWIEFENGPAQPEGVSHQADLLVDGVLLVPINPNILQQR